MFQPTLKVKYGWMREISWPIVALCFMDYLKIDNALQFLIMILCLFAIIGFSQKIFLPQIVGWDVYIISIFCMIFYGFIQNNIRDFIKGSFYVLSSVVVVLVGYYLARISRNLSFEKTIYIVGILVCIKDWITILMDPSVMTDMQSLRDAVNIHIMDIMVILIILFSECIISGKIIFSKKWDIFTIGFMAATIILSMGRTQIIGSILGITLLYLIALVKNNQKQRIIKNVMTIIMSSIVLILLALYTLPSEAVDPFLKKMENSFTEISSESEFDSTEDINNNWRGYENKNAIEQWKEVNVFEELIGQGVGKCIKLKNLDSFHQQKYELVDSASPLLHSGYHTLLVKGGVLAVIGSILWLVFPLIKVLLANNKEKIEIYMKLAAINFSMLLSTYVVRGIVTCLSFLIWGLAMGWYSCKLQKVKD